MSETLLTEQQLRHFVERSLARGGDSVELASGGHPTRGFVVSRAHHELHVGQTLTVDAVRAYVALHAETLAERGVLLGSWQDGDSWYLDASDVYLTRDMAELAARLNDQRAYYDAERGECVAVRDVGGES